MRAARGFTVVELMIAVAVIAILLVAGVPAMRGIMENSRIRAAGESLNYGLALARAEAVRRNTRVAFVVGPGGWQVRTVVGDEVLHQASGQEGTAAVQLAVAPEGTDRVTFDGLGRALDPNPDGSGPIAQIDVASAKPPGVPGYRPLRVQVQPGGAARLCDPKAADDDSRACL